MQININNTAIDWQFKKAKKYLPVRLSTTYFDGIGECIAFAANRADGNVCNIIESQESEIFLTLMNSALYEELKQCVLNMDYWTPVNNYNTVTGLADGEVRKIHLDGRFFNIKFKIMNMYEILNSCLSNMKASEDFNDYATVNSFKDLLSCIIESPAKLINFSDKEKLSTVLSSILVSQFPDNYPIYKDVDVRNLVFAISFFLYMHQLETGMFYDRNWPAFISLLHYGRKEFAKFIVEMNPFVPEKLNEITGCSIDNQRALNAAKGFELSLMITAKNKGFWMAELTDWYNELYEDKDELLAKNPFKKEAIPLYQSITNFLKENDVTFVNL